MSDIYDSESPSQKISKLVSMAKVTKRKLTELDNINERVMMIQEQVKILEKKIKEKKGEKNEIERF